MRPALRRLTSGRWRTAWRLLSATLIVAIGLTQIDFGAVGDALSRLSPAWVLVAFVLLLAGQVVSGLRWGVIAQRHGSRASPRWFIRAYLRGSFYNAFLPTGIGGDAMRIAALRQDLGVRRAGRSVVIDRASGLAAICLAAGACLPFTDYLADVPALRWIVAAIALSAAAALALVLTRRGLAAFAGWTLLFMVVWFGGIWALARALDIDLPAAALPIVTLIVAVAIALPISIGATGTREAGFVVALDTLGVDTETAVALGISFGVVLGLVGLVGAPLSVAPDQSERGNTLWPRGCLRRISPTSKRGQ
jgi:glycosyltransferase 2 family protein